MGDERANELHLLLGVLHDDARLGGIGAQAVGRHDHGQVGRVHLGDGGVGLVGKELQEAYQIGEDEAMNGGQACDDAHARFRRVAVLDTLVVELVGYERLVEFAIPELE